MASAERGWNSISLTVYHYSQTKENSPGDWPPSLQQCSWVDMFSLNNLYLHKMYRPLHPSPWLWYFLLNSSKLFTQSWDRGVKQVNPAPLQFCRSCWGSPRDQLIGSSPYQEVWKENKYLSTLLADQDLACPWRQQAWSAGYEEGNNSSHAPKDHTLTWWVKGKYGHWGELYGEHLIQRQNQSNAVGGSWKTNQREREREKNTAGRIREGERFIKSLKRSLLIPSLLTIGTADWTQAFGKALPLGCTQQGSTPCTAHTAVLPPTKPLQGHLWVYFSLETHHASDVIPHRGLN